MQKKTIGSVDRVDLPLFNLQNIEAKIDTGANRSAIHCSHIEILKKDGVEELNFHIPLDGSKGSHVFQSRDFFKKKIKSSNGHSEERYIIKTVVVLFGKRIKASFSLTDRAEMNYPILLGRKLLKSRFIVDVDEQYLSFKAKQDTKLV
ncbi:ATP-dependent zinc protease family protein [Ekhidna sp. To15]|uniref:ATP-dependent zinc protease family protein n=1 Tax=Ekhidna sp. To15 TaxID=3395267 RepID=UPI003F5247D7